jgi:DNA-binding FadR family transcriptional regulator
MAERLANLLAAEILSGRIGPGQTFPSASEIGTQFSVSRTVAREAIQALSMLGLVRVQHGRRTEVTPSEEWDVLSSTVQHAFRNGEGELAPLIRDIYEFRLLVEPAAASLTAERGDKNQIETIVELARTMTELAESIPPPGPRGAAQRDFYTADWVFHHRIAQATGNLVIAAVTWNIRELVTTLWMFSRMTPEEIRTAAQQHAAIADALVRRDPEAAATSARDHLSWASSLDLRLVDELNVNPMRGPDSSPQVA